MTVYSLHVDFTDVAVEVLDDVFVGGPVEEARGGTLPPNLGFSRVNRHRYHSSDNMGDQKQSGNLEWKNEGKVNKHHLGMLLTQYL